jgi:single-stranded DNA-binding protein
VVDGELDWREWTDQEQNRREAVALGARRIVFERTASAPPAESGPAERDGSPNVADIGASPAGPDDVPL